jgi:hypothetical protein
MARFCLTVHPIWGRILARHPASLGTAYAHDTYVTVDIEPALADTIRSFKQDATSTLKCACLSAKSIIPGMQEERAHQLIRMHIGERVRHPRNHPPHAVSLASRPIEHITVTSTYSQPGTVSLPPLPRAPPPLMAPTQPRRGGLGVRPPILLQFSPHL